LEYVREGRRVALVVRIGPAADIEDHRLLLLHTTAVQPLWVDALDRRNSSFCSWRRRLKKLLSTPGGALLKEPSVTIVDDDGGPLSVRMLKVCDETRFRTDGAGGCLTAGLR